MFTRDAVVDMLVSLSSIAQPTHGLDIPDERWATITDGSDVIGFQGFDGFRGTAAHTDEPAEGFESLPFLRGVSPTVFLEALEANSVGAMAKCGLLFRVPLSPSLATGRLFLNESVISPLFLLKLPMILPRLFKVFVVAFKSNSLDLLDISLAPFPRRLRAIGLYIARSLDFLGPFWIGRSPLPVILIHLLLVVPLPYSSLGVSTGFTCGRSSMSTSGIIVELVQRLCRTAFSTSLFHGKVSTNKNPFECAISHA